VRAVRAGALALLAGLALAGCGGDAFPDEESTDGPVTALAEQGAPEEQAAASVGATRKAAGAAEEAVACPPVAAAPKVRDGLPDLTLDCLGPGPATTLSALRGPLVLNVWASWCGPCADETPYLIELQKKLGSQVRFLGLDVDDKASQAREWLSYMGVPWPSLQDPSGVSRAKLRYGGPPVTLFIRSDGTVAKVHYGAFTSTREVAAAVADHLGVTS
jgi:cytochrome c biogenesis protein CcmG, thiol:disulfide interchange protein DsbE